MCSYLILSYLKCVLTYPLPNTPLSVRLPKVVVWCLSFPVALKAASPLLPPGGSARTAELRGSRWARGGAPYKKRDPAANSSLTAEPEPSRAVVSASASASAAATLRLWL